jgi:SPP1 gp7 family putative phage head morphogenesis protein
LKGVTADMDKEMTRLLTDGLAHGQGAEEIARNLNKSVAGLGKKRARTIARTEIVRAHSEGQLDAFEAMNLKGVGVMAEWSTAHDDVVCAACAPMEGVVLTIKEARGLLPRHPNCRCCYIPANIGEDKEGTTKTTWAGEGQGLEAPGTLPTGQTTGQVWAKDVIGDRLRASILAEKPKLGIGLARKLSKWAGADLTAVSAKLKPGSKAWLAAKKATSVNSDVDTSKMPLAMGAWWNDLK